MTLVMFSRPFGNNLLSSSQFRSAA